MPLQPEARVMRKCTILICLSGSSQHEKDKATLGHSYAQPVQNDVRENRIRINTCPHINFSNLNILELIWKKIKQEFQPAELF